MRLSLVLAAARIEGRLTRPDGRPRRRCHGRGPGSVGADDADYARGGDVHLTCGERHTATVSGSHAGRLSTSTFSRVFGAAARSDDLFQSRTAIRGTSGTSRASSMTETAAT